MSTTVLAILLIPSTYAITTDVNSTEPKATWTPEPRGRGTWSILSNCIFTLVICIWTVIHDDVKIVKRKFPGGEIPIKITPFSRLLSKLQWMLYAFLAPETVIVSAMVQWKKARKLRKRFCSTIGVKEPGGESDILGLEGSFFVIMGGFSAGPMDQYGSYDKILDESDFMDRIKKKGVPDSVDLRQIRDRSKADGIGKFLAIIQALSLVMQCLLRKIDGLTVSLLEFHVVIQVFCAVVIYSFWWSKPQGVTELIPFEQPATRFDKAPRPSGMSGEGRVSDEQHFSDTFPRSPTARIENDQRLAQDIEQNTETAPIPLRSPRPTSPVPIYRSEIFQRAPTIYLFSWATFKEISDRMNEWYSKGLTDKFGDLYMFSGFGAGGPMPSFLVYPLYGALHSIAWNSSYPTPIEQLLWRISCISLIVTPLSFLLYVLLIGDYIGDRLVEHSLLYPAVYIMICRSYLTIECFISLRLLPADAYQTVLWERIWPHI